MERKNDIDIAKAIGIIMVVWAHAGGPFSSYIDQFHMPFFFVLSGILFYMPTSLGKYIKKKVKTLLIPFWKWNFILLLPFWILYFWGEWDIDILIRYIVEIGVTINKVPMLGATWFLPALFWTSISFASIKKVIDILNIGEYKKDLLLFIYGNICCILGMFFDFPYRISRNLICSFFFVIGYLYVKYIRGQKDDIHISKICIMGTGYLVIAFYNDVNIGANEYKYKGLFILGAIMASYVMIKISQKIVLYKDEKYWGWFVRHLIFLGANTMPIVIWHFVFFRLTIIVQIIVMRAPFSALVSFPIYNGEAGWWIIYIICGIYGSLSWSKMIFLLENKFILKKNKGKNISNMGEYNNEENRSCSGNI